MNYLCISGDVLVFLATADDIERASAALKAELGIHGEAYEGANILILPLHGKLPSEESQRAFAPPPPGKRKVIFSTSIAETRYVAIKT